MAKFIKGDVVVVPFPFSDLTAYLQRIVILSYIKSAILK
jgi:hypothetical protein